MIALIKCMPLTPTYIHYYKTQTYTEDIYSLTLLL